MSSKSWHVLRTSSRKELVVKALLTRAHLSASVPVELKTRKAHSRSNNKESKPIEYALFPGYVFLEADNVDWPALRDAPHVHRPLMCDSQPAVVRDEFVEPFKEPRAAPLNRHRDLNIGKLVRVLVGPFIGCEAAIQDVKDGIAELSASLFGRPVRLRIGLDEVQLV